MCMCECAYVYIVRLNEFVVCMVEIVHFCEQCCRQNAGYQREEEGIPKLEREGRDRLRFSSHEGCTLRGTEGKVY